MNPRLKQFIDSLQLSGCAKRTIDNYIAVLTGLIRHYLCDPLQLTNQQIKDYLLFLYRDKKHSAATINLVIYALKKFYTVMAPEKDIMHGITRMKQPKHIPVVLSLTEVEELIISIRNLKHRALVMLLYSAGLRLNECIALRPVHIESSRMKVRVEQGKGKKDRYTLLSERTLMTLREYFRCYRPKLWLFEGRNGKQYSKRSVGKIVAAAACKARIEKTVSPHTLRHSFATHLLEAGVALPVIQKLLGHSSIKTTMIYLHVTEPLVEKIRSPFDQMVTEDKHV